MPDLLREQFPHFRPIVEAFGYRNLEFEGWEADDVIATLATRADEAGIKTTVVSTDPDARHLASGNPAEVVLPAPDRTTLHETFRRFGFRGLLNRMDDLDAAVPAAERPQIEGVEVPWREGDLAGLEGGFAAQADRAAVATGEEVV